MDDYRSDDYRSDGYRGDGYPGDDYPGEAPTAPLGIAASELSDEDLLRELASVHRTRHQALRHRPTAALGHHDRRSRELESEYLRRFPGRELPGPTGRAG
jgi:hypothetical protein